MEKLIKFITLSLAGLLIIVVNTTVHAQKYPKPTGYVNDFVGQLSIEQGTALNDALVALEEKTGIELAVVTVKSLDGQTIEEYTKGLATEWAVGKKGKNNGIVFLVAPNQRKMRIEIASGIDNVFTVDDADKVRDENIIPNFKNNDIPRGIIEGTQAIIQFLDPTLRAKQAEERARKDELMRKENAQDISTFVITFCCMALIAGLGYLIWLLVYRLQSRTYVLAKLVDIAASFDKVEKKANHLDVTKKTRKEFFDLKKEFFKIDQLNTTSTGVNWIKRRSQLDEIVDYSLPGIVSSIDHEIAFAKKARLEGPKLMEKMPGIIEAAEKELQKGDKSEDAMEYLKRAKKEYAEAQSQHSSMSVLDWVILYTILNSIKSNVAEATSTHSYVNNDRSYSANRSSSDKSYDFGNNTGFSGGGGFSGSGSTGSW